MKTKTIFKMLAAAMLMPTMLLTTACSNNDDEIVNTENPANIQKGYTFPVTVNVSRQGDESTTRATYDGEAKKLSFSEGDKLFVMGSHTDAGKFAGMLDYDAVSGKFSGTVTTKNEYTGTIDDLMASANAAVLLPAGYESYGFYSVSGSGSDAMISFDLKKAFALTKAAAVEQFSVEYASSYSSGFALAPMYAIASFTISGLTANKKVDVSFDTYGSGVISRDVTTSATGVATFAVGVSPGQNLENYTLTVDGNNIALPTKTTEPGHIYKISRSVAAAPAATDLSTIASDYTAKDGETLTGTLGSNVKISIADGATVTLNNVTINGTNDYDYEWAGITCEGDATIILEGTNMVKGFFEDYPGIQAAAGKTLTINGTGSLTASSNDFGAGIGGGSKIACGNIEIQGGTITATGNQYSAGIGGGENASCGNITISGGTVNATGGTHGAGIGGGNNASWGNITISGGTVTATGGERGAGIGGGRKGITGSVSSGNILISGGTVTATGGENAAGIGGGRGYNDGTFSSCGTITITTGVTKVTATMGDGATNSIGAGKYCNCGTVTIGGNVGAITTSPYTYQP